MRAQYQYRIYPTQGQEQDLSRLFGCCRVVYNDALAIVKATPKGERWPSGFDLQKIVVTQAKKTEERGWLSEVPSVPLCQSVRDLDAALKNFVSSRKGKRKGGKIGFPVFKKKSNSQSARFLTNAFSIKNGKLRLCKIGRVKVKWSRPLPSHPSSVTITKNSAGQYHASFVVEIEQVEVESLRPSIGVDLGIKTFAFLSTGEKIESPGYGRLDKKIRRAKRKMSRQEKGSKRRERTRLKIAKLHLKTANIRKDFLHKTTTKLIRENQVVCLEDLNVKGMIKNRSLAKAIGQQGWGEFRRMCEAKSVIIADRQVSVISRWEPTSQTCSDCGFRWGKVDLSIRSILCINCGAEHDRDENAAKNIEQSGLELAHDSKWTGRARKTGLPAMPDEPSSQPWSVQLRLFA